MEGLAPLLYSNIIQSREPRWHLKINAYFCISRMEGIKDCLNQMLASLLSPEILSSDSFLKAAWIYPSLPSISHNPVRVYSKKGIHLLSLLSS